ncbi:hypothetical protein B0H67DRAFT_643333 [Lasiosphaeris hirsuta]|uniref:Uncharacterized protein n=1 Tax=Lasiosphaeris hirsuta TaxID=260670 RepID=A0AA40AQE2_9PEZI|nr:hypothetical protein B0H67DRAFT_643333 [Lasiosphaeris hirsuta]
MGLDTPRLITSKFLECRPAHPKTDGPVFTTTYCVTYPAADHTKEWLATYTVKETCHGKCHGRPHGEHDDHGDHSDKDWDKNLAIPPNFVVTTVHCPVCEHKTQTITCPNASGTGNAIIHGNGVTVTVKPTPAPEHGRRPDHDGPDHHEPDHKPDHKPDHDGPDHDRPDHDSDHDSDHYSGPEKGPESGPGSRPDSRPNPGPGPGGKPAPTSGSRPAHDVPTQTGDRGPIATGAAPPSLNLKKGLLLGIGVSLAAGNFFIFP